MDTGLGFKLFVIYLLFVFFNPQLFFAFIAPLRIPLFIAFLAALVSLPKKGITLFQFPQTKVSILFLLFTTISTLNSIDFNGSINVLETYVKGFFLYTLFVLVAHSENNFKKAIWFMVIFLFINGVISFIAGKTGLMPPSFRLVSYFYLGGANDFALAFLALIPLAFGLIEGEKSRSKKMFLIIIILSYLFCLTRTRSRMGFFGLLVWVGQIIWIKRKHRAMILLAAVLVMITFMFTHSGYFERAFDIDQQKADISRINLWKQAFELIKIKPLFGVGPGAFVKAKTFFNIEGDKIHVTHNSFLAVGAENGVLALIMYLLLPILSIRDLFFGERGFVGNHGLRSICQAVRTGIITLCFSMFFLSQQFNHFFWVFLGMSVVLKKLSYNHRQSMNISIPENTENQVRSIVQN